MVEISLSGSERAPVGKLAGATRPRSTHGDPRRPTAAHGGPREGGAPWSPENDSYFRDLLSRRRKRRRVAAHWPGRENQRCQGKSKVSGTENISAPSPGTPQPGCPAARIGTASFGMLVPELSQEGPTPRHHPVIAKEEGKRHCSICCRPGNEDAGVIEENTGNSCQMPNGWNSATI